MRSNPLEEAFASISSTVSLLRLVSRRLSTLFLNFSTAEVELALLLLELFLPFL
jgi:hypothetical protein